MINFWTRFLDWVAKEKNDQILELNKQIVDLNKTVRFTSEENARLSEELNILQVELAAIPQPNPLEAYWNNKRPATNNYKYSARPAIGSLSNIEVDPRVFFVNGDSIPLISGIENDAIAVTALKWVVNNIVYTSDSIQFKDPEVWMFPFETLHLRKGDCEDGAILLANMLMKAGVPYWRIRLNAGDVQGGGHCWVTYLKESDNQWYILDWCYWPSESKNGLLWKDAEKYFDIWFSFSPKNIYANDMLDRTKMGGN